MDTQKLINLALEGNKDNIKEYRDEILRELNAQNLHIRETKEALERIKFIPNSDETVAKLTKDIETTEKVIQDICDTVHIIDNCNY